MLDLILIFLGSIIAWYVLGYIWRNFIVPYFRTEVRDIRTTIIPQQQRDANQIDDNICCFCLAQPKVFRIVATCAHSFCADCILGFYKKHSHEQIDCPLCRKNIITLFKAFEEKEPQSKIQQIRLKIREYNHKFGDDRSIKRTIKELPFVIQNTMNYLFSKDFLLFFIGNAIFLKATAVIIFYLILPYDVLPAKLLGSSVGCIDDTLVILLVLGFAISKVGLQFYRNNQ